MPRAFSRDHISSTSTTSTPLFTPTTTKASPESPRPRSCLPRFSVTPVLPGAPTASTSESIRYQSPVSNCRVCFALGSRWTGSVSPAPHSFGCRMNVSTLFYWSSSKQTSLGMQAVASRTCGIQSSQLPRSPASRAIVAFSCFSAMGVRWMHGDAPPFSMQAKR